MNHLEGEPQFIPEPSEVEKTKGREISVHLFRHGQARYESSEDFGGRLTDEGKLQAKKAAEDLFDLLGQDEVVVFYVSPISRAQETATIMQETLKSLSEVREKAIQFLAPRTRQELRDVIIRDPSSIIELMKSGEKDIVGRWFEIGGEHPKKAETPKEVSQRFQQLLNRFYKLSQRLSTGPKIHFIGITHEEVPALLSEFSEYPDPSPIRLGNCESIRIDFSERKETPPRLRFRGSEYRMKIGGE